MLNPEEIYSRKKEILYDSKGNAIVKFIGSTSDAKDLTGTLVENMNRYITTYPDRIEVLESKNQLTLF